MVLTPISYFCFIRNTDLSKKQKKRVFIELVFGKYVYENNEKTVTMSEDEDIDSFFL